MKATLRLRPFVAVLAMLAVLFSQFAVSAYACPGSRAMAQAERAAMDAMPDCDQTPASERSALCEAHCLQGDQSLDKAGVSLQAAAMPCGYPVAAVARAIDADRAQRRTPDSLLERPTGPSLAVRHCRFRI